MISPDPREPGLPPVPPTPVISPTLAARLNARVLDPTTAVVLPGMPSPMPTVYVGDTLLVRGFPGLAASEQRISALQSVAASMTPPLTVTAEALVNDEQTLAHIAQRLTPEQADSGWVTRVRIELAPQESGPQAASAPVDAWVLLQAALQALGRTNVALEHILSAGGGIWGGGGGIWGGGGGIWGGGGGIWGGGGGIWGGGGVAEYGSPGIGGRTPVVLPVSDPRESARPVNQPPVVAILDTGLGLHPWFKVQDSTGKVTVRDGVWDDITWNTLPIGLTKDPSRDPERTGVIIDPINGLVDHLCGHGTFIAGIIRQLCPEAILLPVPIMASDGAALEGDVILALNLLLERHRQANDADASPYSRLDFINLSLGYHHESPGDAADDGLLTEVLQRLVGEGVAIVACAGNGATSAPFYPAGYSTVIGPGLASVGAVNPDGRTVALFSNNGPWVTAHAPGAGVVSTVPTTLSGGGQSSIHVQRNDPAPRATVDFDDYSSGFAIWSGTSFATPWVVGQAANRIVTGLDASGAPSTGPRALDALRDVVLECQARISGGS